MCLTFSRLSYYALLLETDLLRTLLYSMLCRVSLISSGISSVDYCCRKPCCGFITAFVDVLFVTLNPAVVANGLSAIDVSSDASFSAVALALAIVFLLLLSYLLLLTSPPLFLLPLHMLHWVVLLMSLLFLLSLLFLAFLLLVVSQLLLMSWCCWCCCFCWLPCCLNCFPAIAGVPVNASSSSCCRLPCCCM